MTTGSPTDDEIVPGSDEESGAASDETEADSSPAPEAEAESGSMLDAVTAALNAEKDEGAEGSPPSDGEDAKDPTADDGDGEEPEADDPGEVTDEELRGYHSKTRRRVRHLLSQRDEARAEIENLRPKAEKLDQVTQFIDQSGLSADEVDTGFQVMALLVRSRTDREAAKQARDLLRPYVESLDTATGAILPDDLRQAVEGGYITEDYARQLAGSRADVTAARNAVQEVEARSTQAERAQAEQLRDRIAAAVSQWDQSWKASDPDYEHKQPLVLDRVRLRAMERPPRTEKEAVELAEAVKAEIEALPAFRRTKTERKPVLSGGAARPEPRPQPATMLDVVKSAVGQ